MSSEILIMQIGWIDFSKEDASKVKQIMQMLSESGIIDELGIGVIRDAFSDYFFPSTSTIQTKARYFILVPYVLKSTVKDNIHLTPDKLLKMIDRNEHEYSYQIWKNSVDRQGIIGRNALGRGEWVARTPLDIYWSGIKRLGIFTGNPDTSVYSYILQEQENHKINPEKDSGYHSDDEDEKDDQDAGYYSLIDFWSLPSDQDHWKENLSINLTSEEARFLHEKITMNLEGSLYAFLVQSGNDQVESCTSFEAIYELVKNNVDETMAKMMRLAIGFSRLVKMCYTRYNLLVNSKNETAVDNWDHFQNELVRMTDVNLAEIFTAPQLNYRKDPGLEKFLLQVQSEFQNRNIEAVDKMITEREFIKKRNRRRINNPKKNDSNAGGFHGNNGLDYRFGIAKNYISEIRRAENDV